MQRYDAFISYSHAGDGRLAPRLQSGLERYARPWWKRRVLRVFRDETGLSASPHLWTSIVDALDNSDWFIVLASPEAATSEWVGREIEHWVTHRDPERILVAVTDGAFTWDEAAGEIDWPHSSAAHPRLLGAFRSEPRYIDLTWARTEVTLDRRDGRFQDALAELAAPLRGIPKDELAGEDVRQHRRTIRLARGAATALALLTATAVVAGVLAIGQRDEARQQRTEADSQRSEAQMQRAEAETQRAEAEAQRAEAETQRTEADAQRVRADDQALVATARGAAAGAIAQADVGIDRSLLLAAAAVGLSDSPETTDGLLAALESASALVAFHHEVGDVAAFDVSPNGERIATLGVEGRVQIWRAADYEPIAQTMLDAKHPYSIEYVGSGDVVGLITDSGVVRLDASTLKPIGKPITPSALAEVSAVVGDIASDGSLVAVGQLDSPVVEVFDTATGQATTTFSLGADCIGGVRGIDINTVTARVAAVCLTMTAMYDLNTGALVSSRQSFDSNGPLFSPDGRILAVGYTVDVLVLIDTATFRVIDQVDTPGTRVYSMDFTEDGQFLAVGSDSGDVDVYSFVPDYTTFDQATGEVGTWTAAAKVLGFSGIEGGVRNTAFVPTTDVSSGVPSMIVGGPSGLSLWDQAMVPTIANDRYRYGQIGWVLLDPGAREVYRPAATSAGQAGSTEFEVVHLDGTVDRRLQVAGERVNLLDISSTSDKLATTGAVEWPDTEDGSAALVAPSHLEVQIVDPAAGAVITSLDLAAEQPIVPLDSALVQFAQLPDSFPDGHYAPSVLGRFSPDGTRLVVQMDNATSVWDTATGALIAKGSIPLGTSGGWGTDSTMLVSGTLFGRLDVYSANDLRLIDSVDISPGYSISDIEPLIQTNQLLVTSEVGNISVVDGATLEVVGAPFQASGTQLQQTAVDQTGTMIAALDRAGKLRLWRFADRTPIGPPLSVVSSPGLASADIDLVDGGAIVSQGGLSATYIPLTTADLVTRACQLAGRQLTSEEWQKFVGDRPQVPCM